MYKVVCFILFVGLLVSCGKDSPTETKKNTNPIVSSITANPSSLGPGQASTITVAASDPDGDALSYSYAATGGSVSGTSSTATFTAGSSPGSASVTVTVSDGKGGIATGSTTLTIAQSPVTFSISAQSVPASGGGECLLFTAIPAETVILISVQIVNPVNQSDTFNLQSVTVLGGQAIALQNTGSCWTKRSGLYRFTFTGTRPGGGSFTSTASYTQP